MLGIYLLCSIATLVFGLIGWFGVSYFISKYRNTSNVLSFSIGSLIFLSAFLFYGVALFYSGIFNRITILLPLVVLFPFAFKFVKQSDPETKILSLLFVSMFTIGILLQTLLPYYPIGGDWFSHYKTSSDYLKNNEITFLNGRPPVFNFLGAMFLKIFADNFWIYQIASVFLNSLVIIPLYLIAKFFDKRIALTAVIFVLLNSFVLQNTIYTWPKNLTSFFILFFFYFALRNQTLFSVLPASLALYTSPISLFFLPAGFIYSYFKKNKDLLKSALLIILIFMPFALYSLLKTGTGETTPFLLYPIAVNGYESLITEPLSKTIGDFLSKSIYYIIGIRIIVAIMTMFPALLALKFLTLFVNLPVIQIQKTVVVSQVPLLYHFMHSIPGALSTLVYVFSMIGLYNLFKRDRNLFFLFVLPLVFAILYWGWIKAGLMNDLLQPLVPLLIMVAVSQMKSKKLIYLSLAVMLIEGVIFGYVYHSQIADFIRTTTDQEMLSVDSINRLL